MNNLTLIPAYGRDYKSAKDVRLDWSENKDFQIASWGRDCGRYINKSDAESAAPMTVVIRYSRLAKLTTIQVRGRS